MRATIAICTAMLVLLVTIWRVHAAGVDTAQPVSNITVMIDGGSIESPCGPSIAFDLGAGNTTLVANDGGPNRIYLCGGLFNTPVAESFGLLEGPPANNCDNDGGTGSVTSPVVCGLNNDGGTCYFNAGGGWVPSGTGPAIATTTPGHSLCVSTDGGEITGYYSVRFAP